jgi:hypothetical protein
MPTVGLQFDLSAWRKGVRDAGAIVRKGISATLLRPFDIAVRKTVRAMRATFAAAGNFIKGVLSSALAPLLGLLAVAKIIDSIKDALTGSLAAYRQYADSVTVLRAALNTLGARIDTDGAVASVKELGEQLRLAMGITGTEVNQAFAALLTRGFDMAQARQLTILAANYAKKSGKPIQDVARQIADAANGSVNAMKDLGVQIVATGDRVRDGEAAVIALKAAYGDIGSELANPSERLAAAWNMLAVSLGEKISPILEPIIQGFSDLVVGLTRTEQGQQVLQAIADALRDIVERISSAIVFVSNLVQMIKSGGSVIVALLKGYINEAMQFFLDQLRKLPGADWLLERMGLDGKKLSEALGENAKAAADQVRAATNEFARAQDSLLRGDSGAGFAGQFGALIDAGRRAREEAAASLQQEIGATAGLGFAGRPAQEIEAAKAARAQAAQEQAAARQREAAVRAMNTRVAGMADARAGQQVSVRIMSTRPDRFRKARAR